MYVYVIKASNHRAIFTHIRDAVQKFSILKAFYIFIFLSFETPCSKMVKLE